MEVEAQVAAHAVRLDQHDERHAEHRAELDRIWEHIEAGRVSREATVVALSDLKAEVAKLGAILNGDVRRAVWGMVAVIGVLALLVLVLLAAGPASVGAWASGMLQAVTL